jgi:hypothetical protein
MAHEGKLTTSWISPFPTKDLLNGSGAHELRDDDRMVTVHSPFDHCVAYLTKQRAKLLWRWYCETNPEDGTPEKFAIETAAMYAYYSSKRLDPKNSRPPHQCWFPESLQQLGPQQNVSASR